MALHESEVTDLITEVLSFCMCGSIHYAIQQLSPRAWLYYIHQGTLYVLKKSSTKELSQVTSVAKQPDPVPDA